MQKMLIAATTLAILLAACGHGASKSFVPGPAANAPQSRGLPSWARSFPPTPSPVLIQDSEIDRNIDSDVPPADRATLSNLMHALPEDARRNVVLMTGNKVIANHRSLTTGLVIAPPGAKTFVNSHGERVTAAQRFTAASTARRVQGVYPPTSDLFGPFQRTWNPQNHSYISSYPSLPCLATPDNQPGANYGPYGDTGYIYFANFTDRDDFEGGLQYSRTRDWYVPYTNDQHDGQRQMVGDGGPFPITCGQNFLSYQLTYRQEFFVVANNWVAMHYRGWGAPGQSHYVDVTITRLPGNGSGWSAPCPNCTLSMTTSIAQTRNDTDGYWKDGYAFGADTRIRDPRFYWQQTTLGNCIASGNNTDCSTQFRNEPAFRDRFPNDRNQVLYQIVFGTGYSMDTKAGLSLATDRNQAPLTPSSYTDGGSPVPTPAPAPCAVDDYGACGYYTSISTSTCDMYGDGSNLVQYPYYWFYTGYSTATGAGTDFTGRGDMGTMCGQFTGSWQPQDPQSMYSDPYMPGPYDQPPI